MFRVYAMACNRVRIFGTVEGWGWDKFLNEQYTNGIRCDRVSQTQGRN